MRWKEPEVAVPTKAVTGQPMEEPPEGNRKRRRRHDENELDEETTAKTEQKLKVRLKTYVTEDVRKESEERPSLRRSRRSHGPVDYAEQAPGVDDDDETKLLDRDRADDGKENPRRSKRRSARFSSPFSRGSSTPKREKAPKPVKSVPEPDKKTAGKGPKLRLKTPKKHERHLRKEHKQMPDPSSSDPTVSNEDYCSACGGAGKFVCCETCPRSFHLLCCDPPLSEATLPEDAWYCNICYTTTHPPDPSPRGLFSELLDQLARRNPRVFKLPITLQRRYEGVSVGPEGEFVNEFDVAPKKPRDPDEYTRLEDGKGNPVLCFHCSRSALAGPILTCTKCNAPWHVDCLKVDSQFNIPTRWVCPNHAEQATKLPRTLRKPRIRDTHLRRGYRNNGYIEVHDSEDEVDGTARHKQIKTEVEPAESSVQHTPEQSKEPSIEPSTAQNTPLNSEIPSEPPEKVQIIEVQEPYGGNMTHDQGPPLIGNVKETPDGFAATMVQRQRDDVVYRLPARAIKLDFIDMIHSRARDPWIETPASRLLVALDELATKPSEQQEAVRNLAYLKLQGPSVDAATAKQNIDKLVTVALDDRDNQQALAIRRLIQLKGKDRLMDFLTSDA